MNLNIATGLWPPGSAFFRIRRSGLACALLIMLALPGLALAQPVINEIMQNPSAVSDSAGEWFELHNPTGSAIDIEGWTVEDDGSDSFVISNGGPLLIPAGGYLVLGNNGDSGSNGGVSVDYVYTGMFLANGGDELVLRDGVLAEQDRVNWDGGPAFPDPNGASMSLEAPALDNNVGANWCTSTTPFGAGDLGTPGAANVCTVPELAPSVVSTVPVNGAAGVPLDADISLEFSEAVNVSGAWFAIGCSDSGAHSAVMSGGPVSFGLDPDVDFTAGETCTVDIFAAGVSDQDSDDPPDNMNSDFSFSFTTTDGVLAELVINEIDYDQSGTDTGEFIEIRNNSADAVSLNGFALDLINGNGDSSYRTLALPDVLLAAGDYFVVCGDDDVVPFCDLDVSPDSNLVQNGSPDAVALVKGAVIIDTVSYEGDVAAPYTEGSGAGLFDSAGPFLGISRSPDGQDTDMNNVDFALACITPGSANSSASSDCEDPSPPQFRINEIDYDQPGSDTAEFIELVNAGSADGSLLGFELLLVNGSGGGAAIYNTIALPDQVLGAGEHFVVCGNAANVSNCDLDVSPDSNLVQNGSPDAVALVLDGSIVDTVSYEGDTAAPYTEGSGAGLTDSGSTGQDHRGISRFPDGADTDVNHVDLVNACITPGFANTSLTADCSPDGPVLEIFQIQGAGAASPFDGQGVATQDNIVTAVGPEGFFMQTPDARDDANGDTSNGIFVFTGGAPGVSAGDQVDVAGQVVEFFDFTEFAAGSVVSVDNSGQPLPAATVFDAFTPSPDPMAPDCALPFECWEGMLISITGGTVTGPNQGFGSDPVAEVHITAAGQRTFREPGIEFPGIAPFPEWDGNPEVFELDPDKLGLPNTPIPAGSSFDAVGGLGFEFGGYELWPSSLSVTPAALPVAVRPRMAGEMTVGALNLFRLFDDVDDPPIDVIDPNTNAVIRTTDDQVLDAAEYARRLAKFSSHIRDVLDAPDILAVSEVESLAVLQDLADAIHADDAALAYAPYLEEGNDIGGIDVGFLVRDTVVVDQVTQLGRFEILGFDGSLLNDRPPLLLEGRQVADGSNFPIAVMALHGRSLGGIETSERVRQKRYEQAQSVAQKVQALQALDPDINLVVAGDFNAFEFTDGLVDVTGLMRGQFNPADNLICDSNPCTDHVNPDLMNAVTMIPAGERYSFIFRGNAQALDHALTSTGLDELVRDFGYGRGNSDAAADLINDAASPLRSSDHDGLVLHLAKDSDGDGVTDDLDACANTTIPETAPTRSLGRNHFVLLDDDRQFDTGDVPGEGPGAAFDIFDTAGCSCEQISEQLGLGGGHAKFGCSLGEMEAWVDMVAAP